MNGREWQFDGLVGPTHNYAGLAHGNKAAIDNAGAISNPRAAALQGLKKMKFVRDLGVPQAFLPPHFRPAISHLRRLGFSGTVASVLVQAHKAAPHLVASVFSSSFMWTANAATVAPSQDTADGKLHLTPSNMTSHFHRAIESEFSYQLLSRIFHNASLFSVHKPLYPHAIFGDEGAANHMVVNTNHNASGCHIFVYGENSESVDKPHRYPARQKLTASQAVARGNRLDPQKTFYVQQAPSSIDQGMFHNDVIAMNTTQRLIVHAEAFVGDDQQRLRVWAREQSGLVYREIGTEELSVAEAVATYFFNSQLIDLSDNNFVLIAPSESADYPKASAFLTQLTDEGILHTVHFRDLRESMRNGGGPACLRLRVVMNPQEAAAIHPGIILTDARYAALKQWVSKHYRDRLAARDFLDPLFIGELEKAYIALESIIEMPGLYAEGIADLYA